jgi:hypothetical protein
MLGQYGAMSSAQTRSTARSASANMTSPRGTLSALRSSANSFDSRTATTPFSAGCSSNPSNRWSSPPLSIPPTAVGRAAGRAYGLDALVIRCIYEHVAALTAFPKPRAQVRFLSGASSLDKPIPREVPPNRPIPSIAHVAPLGTALTGSRPYKRFPQGRQRLRG